MEFDWTFHTKHLTCMQHASKASGTWQPSRTYPVFLMHTTLLTITVRFVPSGHWEKHSGWLRGRFAQEHRPPAGTCWAMKRECVANTCTKNLTRFRTHIRKCSCERAPRLTSLTGNCSMFSIIIFALLLEDTALTKWNYCLVTCRKCLKSKLKKAGVKEGNFSWVTNLG